MRSHHALLVDPRQEESACREDYAGQEDYAHTGQRE